MNRLAAVFMHVVMLAIVCAIAAYWALRILTPLPTAAPPPLAAPPPRDPDPVLTARMFGLVQTAPTAAAINVQVSGVFSAGADSSAVLIVDGKPARAYLVGQEVAPGTRLVEVHPDGVLLEAAGGRQELKVPPRPVASFGGAPPSRAFNLTGNTLSTPTAPGGAAPAPATAPASPRNVPGAGPLVKPRPLGAGAAVAN